MSRQFTRHQNHPNAVPGQEYRIYAEHINELQEALEEDDTRIEELDQAIQEIELTPGPEGKSAYEVAIDNGFVGTEQEWLNSLQGELGEGKEGPAGPGVATGGSAGQVLSKVDETDFNTQWIDPPQGGGIAEVPPNHPHTVGPEAPENPEVGAIWFNPDEIPEPDNYDLIEEKGDLLVGKATATLGRLPVGLPGQVLIADPDSPLGVRWENPPEPSSSGGGGFVQIYDYFNESYFDIDIHVSADFLDVQYEIMSLAYPFE
jgi:hypothetical protein